MIHLCMVSWIRRNRQLDNCYQLLFKKEKQKISANQSLRDENMLLHLLFFIIVNV